MKFVFSLLGIFLISHAFAQTPSDKMLQKEPYWIAMINDSTTNYFEAINAFNQYWSVRPAPVEEDEILGEGEEHANSEGFFDRLITTKEEKAEMESQQYAFEYKRFKQWQLRVEPWVREDGSIATPTEQLHIWENRFNQN